MAMYQTCDYRTPSNLSKAFADVGKAALTSSQAMFSGITVSKAMTIQLIDMYTDVDLGLAAPSSASAAAAGNGMETGHSAAEQAALARAQVRH